MSVCVCVLVRLLCCCFDMPRRFAAKSDSVLVGIIGDEVQSMVVCSAMPFWGAGAAGRAASTRTYTDT